jgi:hypothetical protein
VIIVQLRGQKMRYKFHEQRDCIKKNPTHALPIDINEPVIDFFNKLGAKLASLTVEKLQKNVNYAKITTYKAAEPNKKYYTEVNLGMCANIETTTVTRTPDGWVTEVVTSIRNKNLDMSKPKGGSQ